MSTNKKVLAIVISMLLIVSLISVLIFSFNFKQFGLQIAKEQASSLAKSVRDGLTAHMLSGTMDKRQVYLDNIAKHQKVTNFHILRAPSVVKQYGHGFDNENVQTSIELKVLETKEQQIELEEHLQSEILKISIPYIARSSDSPNCMQCHNAKEGEVLGAISMVIDITETRNEALTIIFQIFVIVLILIIISIFLAEFFIKPYIKLFDDLETSISKSFNGDFSYTIHTKLKNEAGLVAHRLNEFSELYKFKNTIELDENQNIIYNRIIHILKTKFDIKDFILFEIDTKLKQRQILFKTIDLNEDTLNINSNSCRACRIKNSVCSDDFDDICLNCEQQVENYMCQNFVIDESYSLVLHIQTNTKEELLNLKENIPAINNYFSMAKPIIETKILMGKLRETTLKDPMTSLYNRRFLNEILDSQVSSRVNEGCVHSMLMIDVDFFKQVNDKHGHDIGDLVIKKLASIMQSSIRDSDMAIRYGGEEFIILLLNTKKEKTMQIAQTIKDDFSKENFSAPMEVFSKTLSIGIAYYPLDAPKLWQCIKYADEALYIAKETGRNKIVEFTPSMHHSGEKY